ncbi:MAG TPA: sigma-E factor negative regulatory protein [Nitrosospira sp.]|nr:sigma-E factor negative regulatory protein [Nitrosospira sp.]
MKEKLSALMDGELDSDDTAGILAGLKQTDELREQWAAYHLISDTLSQPEVMRIDISNRVMARLAAEPTALAPRATARHRPVAFAAAASIAALAVAGWMSLHTTPPLALPQANLADNGTPPATSLTALPATPVAGVPYAPVSAPERMNDYLMAHREFSPGAGMHGAPPPYVRTVSEPRQNFAR